MNPRIARELDRPRFYRVGEAAAMVNLSAMTLYRAIQAGEFPAVRVRNRIIVPARAIDDIEQAAVTSNSVIDTANFTTTALSASPQAGPRDRQERSTCAHGMEPGRPRHARAA